jgi:hypothetical protein
MSERGQFGWGALFSAAVEFDIVHEFAAHPDRVAAALLDLEYQSSLGTLGPLKERAVLDQSDGSDGRVTRRIRSVLDIQLPRPARIYRRWRSRLGRGVDMGTSHPVMEMGHRSRGCARDPDRIGRDASERRRRGHRQAHLRFRARRGPLLRGESRGLDHRWLRAHLRRGGPAAGVLAANCVTPGGGQ